MSGNGVTLTVSCLVHACNLASERSLIWQYPGWQIGPSQCRVLIDVMFHMCAVVLTGHMPGEFEVSYIYMLQLLQQLHQELRQHQQAWAYRMYMSPCMYVFGLEGYTVPVKAFNTILIQPSPTSAAHISYPLPSSLNTMSTSKQIHRSADALPAISSALYKASHGLTENLNYAQPSLHLARHRSSLPANPCL